MNKVQAFETERLLIKPITLKDAEAYQKHFNDFAVISQLASAVPWPYPEEGALDFIESVVLPDQGNDRWFWGIFLKSNPSELIGAVELWRQGTPENRGFWIGEKFWGKGIMTEAVLPVTDYAFETLGFDRLTFSNAVGNLRSRRIKEKTGARLIGNRGMKFVNPEYTQAETWELTRFEWFKFRERRTKN